MNSKKPKSQDIDPNQPITSKPTGQSTDPKDQQILDLKNRLARALADYSNLEKRFERDSSSIIQFANSNLLGRLLEVRDHLGMAAANGLSAGKAGDTSLKMILATFDKLLTDEGVTEVKVDGMYDPATMECHETVPGEKDKVITVASRGYLLHGKLLRAARVTVGNGDASKQQTVDSKQEQND